KFTVLRPPVERAERVDDRADPASRHRRREVIHKLLHVATTNVGDTPTTETRLDVHAQHLVDIVDRARLVATAALVERPPFACRFDEFLSSLTEAQSARLYRGLAAVKARLQICPRIARSFGRSEATGADGSLLGAVVDLAPVGGLAGAALTALLELAALLMAGEDALVAGASVSGHGRDHHAARPPSQA